jgi:hypothetical protein
MVFSLLFLLGGWEREREREGVCVCVCVCVRARSSVAALTLVSTSLPLKYELTMVVGLKSENQGVVITQLQNWAKLQSGHYFWREQTGSSSSLL